MPTLRLIRSHDPLALLEAAAAGFLTPGPGSQRGASGESSPGSGLFPSPDHLLVLRQGGLRDDVLALAAERGVPGWFDPPLCVIQQLPEWLGSTARKPCGDYERVVLLSRLLRERAPSVFGRLSRPDAFVDAVDRLFGELVAEGVEAGSFAAALEARPDRDSFEHDRDADLTACYRAYREILAGSGRRDGRDWLVDCARAVASDPGALAERLGGRREIRIYGLQDLRGGWRPLLRALCESPALDAVVLYSCVALEPLEDLDPAPVEWLADRDAFAARLFVAGDVAAARPGATPAAPRQLDLVFAPDADRETEYVARSIRALIDAGAKPERIAVVARSARPWVDRVLDALGLYGVPATARRRHAFAEIPVVRAVLALFAVAADGWTRHGLVELAEQPYFGRMSADDAPARRLDPIVLNHIGYRRRVVGLEAWIEAHRALRDAAQEQEARREARREAGEDEERRGRDAPPPAYRVRDALAALQSFSTRAGDLDRSRPLREWVHWLRDFLTEDPWRIEAQLYRVPDGRYDVARIDAAGLRGMRRIIEQWEDALTEWQGGEDPIDVVAFESLLREMLSGDAALWTHTRRGVRVEEGLAAAQRAFDHVFVVGLSGDTFPLRARRSPVLDEPARLHLARAGVPVETRDVWEARERELFRVLVAGARQSLTLCCPRTDGEGRELAASAFMEEVVIAAAGDGAWHAMHKAIARGETHVKTGLVRAIFPAASDIAPPMLPLIPSPEQREFALHGARIERMRRSGRLSPYNGLIEEPGLLEWLAGERLGEATHVWSATQIEAYAKCPWSWFSQRLLQLDDLDDPDIDMDPLVRGTILHDALRRFYEQAGERAGEPVFLRRSDLEWVRPVLAGALEAAIVEVGSTAWLGSPALGETKRAELERMLVRYLEWEVEYNESHFNPRAWKKHRILRTGVEYHEMPFGSMTGSESGDDEVLDLDGVRFRLRGSIDRVETGVDERLDDAAHFVAAVDYKSGKYSTPGGGDPKAWDDAVVLQVPLYAHVLERRMPGVRVCRVEYRAIKQRETVHSLELFQIREPEGLVSCEDSRDQMERALAAAGRHVGRARAGQFPAAPAESCACSPFCHAWDICRVAGGPKTKW